MIGEGRFGPIRLTQTSIRDLSPLTFKEQESVVYYLWLTNAMAGRIIEIICDYVIGDGISWYVKNKKADDLLWEFWNDPANDMELYQYDMVQELFLYGELVIPVEVNKNNGKVRIGYIDPANIIEVRKNPYNPRFTDSIVVSYIDPDTQVPKEKELFIIKKIRDINDKDFGKIKGDCFLFQLNKVSNAERGLSEIFRVADWIKGVDDLLFTSMERVYYLMNFIWDITIAGVHDEDKFRKIKEELLKERFLPGSIHIHTDAVNIQPLTPSLGSEQLTSYIELIKNFVLGGAGIPTSWYGEGDITRATAQEQATPVLRRLRRKQKYVKRIFEKILNFVIYKAVEHGRLVEGVDFKDYDEIYANVVMTEITPKDMSSAVGVFGNLISIIGKAQEFGWISHEKAQELFYNLSKRILDIEIEPEEIEKETLEKEDIFNEL